MADSIKEVKARHLDELMAIEGVVSVGIGKNADQQPSIICGLDGERPEAAQKIPRQLEGYPVTIKVVGPLKAL